MPNARLTEFGNYNVKTRVVSRSSSNTYIIPDSPEEHTEAHSSQAVCSESEGQRWTSIMFRDMLTLGIPSCIQDPALTWVAEYDLPRASSGEEERGRVMTNVLRGAADRLWSCPPALRVRRCGDSGWEVKPRGDSASVVLHDLDRA